MQILVVFILVFVPNVIQASKNGLFSPGGISLSSDGHLYEITTQECPGGIFFPQAVNETCLCYNGIFAIVRDCCTDDDGLIATDTLEWRKNYQCGVSPEIGNPGLKPIRAILPLTKANKPFRPVITLQEFSGDSFQKWRKFDLMLLSNVPEPPAFVNSSTVEIVNVQVLPKEARFKIGKFGDVDICYNGWKPDRPQTLRISVYEYSQFSKKESYCCFQVRQGNSPGVITSPCREGSIVTEMIDIDSVNRGNDCPNQGQSTKVLPVSHKSSGRKIPKNLIRFKRSEGSAPKTSYDKNEDSNFRFKRQAPSNATESLSYALEELAEDSLDEQHRKLRMFTLLRKQRVPEATKEPKTQRFILLKKSIEIFLKAVPNALVPKTMVQDAFEAFFYLYESLDMNNFRLNDDQFQRTLNVLGNCSANMKTWGQDPELFYANGSCPFELESVIVTFPNGTKSAKIPAPLPPAWLIFDTSKLDIFVEFNWKIVDLVHSLCFDKFSDDFSAHHFYENQMEILFLQKFIQQRWNRTIEEEDNNYNKGIIKEIDRDIRIKELDKAVGVAHLISKYMEYLHRPSVQNLVPKSELFQKVQSFEAAVAERLQASRSLRLHDYETDEDFLNRDENNDPGFNGPETPIVSHELGLGDTKYDASAEKHYADLLESLAAPAVIGESPLVSEDIDVNKYDVMANEQFARDLEENGEDPALVRSKKHIRHNTGKQIVMPRNKPGDTIWNGLAVCLDAKSNDDPAYYTQEELWGTKPSLRELGMKYPLNK